MTLYVTIDAASLSERVLLDDSGSALWCATMVLRRPDGPVGFDLREGDEVLETLLGEVVVIEAANEPRWVKLERGGVAASKMAVAGRVVVACSELGDTLLGELEKVRRNQLNMRKNVILARHGRPLVVTEATWFKDWIAEDGRVRESALRRLVAHCAHVSLWSYCSGNGYKGRVLGRSRGEALAPIRRLEGASCVGVVQVERETDLPTW
jgi:hypothetical protein